MKEELMSVIPDYKQRTLTYDMNPGDISPGEDDYLVTITKSRSAGSVYQVVSSRKVNSEKHPSRFVLKVISVPELVPLAIITGVLPNVTINGRPAFPVFWYSRNKKKKNGKTAIELQIAKDKALASCSR